ncbi:MAG: roadblock/LC7 domain-containing protein [Candidatus Njordarchaeia archaeon]
MAPILGGKRSIRTIQEQLTSVLKEMENKDPDIEGSLLLRTDGLVLASAVAEGIDRDLAAAMSASILNVGSRVLEELKKGTVENVIVRGSGGVVMVIAVNPEIVLGAIGKKDSNLGLMLVEMRRTAEKINKILESL